MKIFVKQTDLEAETRLDDIDPKFKVISRRTSWRYTIVTAMMGVLAVELLRAIFYDWYAWLLINRIWYIAGLGIVLLILVAVFLFMKWRAEKDFCDVYQSNKDIVDE